MDNYEKVITFNYPDYIPVSMSIFKTTWQRHGESLHELAAAHPNIFPNLGSLDDILNRPLNWQYTFGGGTDHWGCEWDNLIEGHDSFCVSHALPDISKVDDLPIPEADIGLEHGFMFLRLTYLRGYEECMIDFAEERPEFFKLIEKVIRYTERQVSIALSKMKPGDRVINFGDDLGMQTCLPTGPEKWRKILKPCFERIYKPCKAAGKLIFMHTDGCIYEIIPDLKDCGVDIVNPQFRANGLDNLVRATRGAGRNRIAVHLDLDRQLFPFATPSELEDHVMESAEALGLKEGGLSISAEISEDVPLENIGAILCALEKARVYYS
jgi:hypothetical protein